MNTDTRNAEMKRNERGRAKCFRERRSFFEVFHREGLRLRALAVSVRVRRK